MKGNGHTNGGDRHLRDAFAAQQRTIDELLATTVQISEKLNLLLAGRGFYTPKQVKELSTLSPSEISRQQADGTFPRYVELGTQKRVMPREWLERWIYLRVRGRRWTRDEEDLMMAGQAFEEEARSREAEVSEVAAR